MDVLLGRLVVRRLSDAGLARDRLGQQRLAGAGRAVEQESLGGTDAEPAEGIGRLERQLVDRRRQLGKRLAGQLAQPLTLGGELALGLDQVGVGLVARGARVTSHHVFPIPLHRFVEALGDAIEVHRRTS